MLFKELSNDTEKKKKSARKHSKENPFQSQNAQSQISTMPANSCETLGLFLRCVSVPTSVRRRQLQHLIHRLLSDVSKLTHG